MLGVICKIAWLLLLFTCDVWSFCPENCSCRSLLDNIRVKCGGTEQRVSNIKDVDFAQHRPAVVMLDFSKNAIVRVDKSDFVNFTALRRIDLSFNSIKEIDKNTFDTSLPLVERLRLANNSISHILEGSFDHMLNLKQLDISNNPLVCDCDLIWLVSLSNTRPIKLQPAPKCESPIDFKGTLLKKLKVGQDLYCDSPAQPMLDLVPSSSQVVFEGDELVLKCRAPRIAIGVPRESEDLPTRAHIFWGWSENMRHQNSTEDIVFEDPTKVFTNAHLEDTPTTDSGILSSILKISRLVTNNTGLWDCTLRSPQANLSQTIAVLVISKATEYCRAVKVHSNKGTYFWPQTVRGQIVQQECVEDSLANWKATYHCSNNGTWIDFDTNNCPFVSETTRILEQFAKVNLTLAKGNTLEIARQLHDFTITQALAKKMRDPMDLEFIARSLLKFLNNVQKSRDIAYLLLDIVSQLLLLPQSLFYEAQRNHQTGMKLMSAAEEAAAHLQSSSLLEEGEGNTRQVSIPNNLFIDYFNIRLESFAGISCLWLRTDGAIVRTFQCSISNDSFPIFEKHIDAAIHVPLNLVPEKSQKTIKLLVAIFRNGNLLPYISESHNATADEIVTSAVIGAKPVNDSSDEALVDLSEKISVILRVRPYHNDESAPVPAWWDSGINVWNTRVCQKLYMHRGLLMFSCSRFGFYGVLQKRKFLNDFPNEGSGSRFRFAQIGIYFGCSVLFICSWINIVTFVAFGRAIRINRQQRHSLVNTWLALSTLSLVFAVGFNQTEHHWLCMMFGVLLHYLTLCVLLWMCVGLSTMYKRLSKNRRVVAESDFPNDVRIEKPILGIYLVGWGISMIICGISSAVNISDYASYSFCFLHNAPSLNAVIVPAVILLVFLGILLLRIYCHISQTVVNTLHNHQLSDNTQATENIDLNWHDSSSHSIALRIRGQPDNLEQYKSLTLSNALSSIVDDYERSNFAHLRAYFILLLLFTMSWLAAISYVVQSTGDAHNRHYLFSVLFAVSCTLLGIFLLVFYNLSRNDSRNEWNLGLCCSTASNIQKAHNRTNNNANSTATTVVAYKSAHDANNSSSRSNSQCSKHRANSVRSFKMNPNRNERDARAAHYAAHQLGADGGTSSIAAINNRNPNSNNLNVVLTHDIPSSEIFYNPNQVNVARKFFKKQKRLAKRNNFDMQRQMERFECADNMSDVSSLTESAYLYSKRHNAMTLLSGGSKVNNTNIHYRRYLNGQEPTKSNSNFLPPAAIQDTFKPRNNIEDVVANIYTNTLETRTPQHVIVKLRGSGGGLRSCKQTPVEILSEQDELEQESNVPLYENTPTKDVPKEYNKVSHGKEKIAYQRTVADQNTELPTEQLPYNDMRAMNDIGLPNANCVLKEVDDFQQVVPELEKNEIYVSTTLQITNRINVDENFPAVLMRFSQKHSKSLDNLNLNFNASQPQALVSDKLTSTSDNDISQTPSTLWKNGSSLSISEGKGEQKNNSESIENATSSHKCESSVNSTELNPSRNRTLSASPTNESDLNYQNSEVSIRSHGLYAPQADNDLNLTLNDEFPYQSSNVSDSDDVLNDFEEDFDSFIVCHPNDLAMHGIENQEAMNTSIDELYEAIKHRNSNYVSPSPRSDCVDLDAANTSILTNSINIDKTDSYTAPKIKDNLNDTLDDDSSLSSVISYIDPKANGTHLS